MKKRLNQAKKTSKKVLKHKGFLYLLSGGTATAIDIGSYYILFNIILKKQDIDWGWILITAPVASFIISYSLGFITNFIITKYVVFKESNLNGGKQLVRYMLVAVIVFIANYSLLKILVETFGFYPTIGRAFSAGLVAIGSYTIHKFYTFKVID